MNTLEERILLRPRVDMLNYIRLKASFDKQYEGSTLQYLVKNTDFDKMYPEGSVCKPYNPLKIDYINPEHRKPDSTEDEGDL